MDISQHNLVPRDFYEHDGETVFEVGRVRGVACTYVVYGSLDGIPSEYSIVCFPDGPPVALTHATPGWVVHTTPHGERPVHQALSNAAAMAALGLANALAMEDVLVEST